MAKGIDRTIQLLVASKNKAAAQLLEGALKSSDERVRKQAGAELIAARGSKGMSELIRHFDPSDKEIAELFQENRDKSIQALRAALLGKDPELVRNALRAANTQQFFELIPLLLTVFMERSEQSDDESSLADSILKLVDKFVLALNERKNRRLIYGTILPEACTALAKGLKDFHRNDPKLILRVFLALYPFIPEEQAELADVLRNPSLPAYLPLYHVLLSEDDIYAFQFIFHCMDNIDPPPIVLSIFSKRSDIRFLAYMFKQVKDHLSIDFDRNLAKIQHLEWTEHLRTILDLLSDDSQAGLVEMIGHLKLPASEIQSLLIEVFKHGSHAGRLGALETLLKFPGERIDQLLWEATDDRDPAIQIAALSMLRQRDLPKATVRILQYIDSPDPKVRETVQSLLPEFRLTRYMETFEQMTEEQRRLMFRIVRKLDPGTIDELTRMLTDGDALEQTKALLCVEYGELAGLLEDSLCVVLVEAKLPSLRTKAADLLAGGRREGSRSALVQAFHRDSSPEVRAAAKASLEKRPAPWSRSKGGPDNE